MRKYSLAVALLWLLGSWSGVVAQTYSGLYSPWMPWDQRLKYSGTVQLLDASGGVIGTLTLRSLFDSPITALFPPVGALTTGATVRVLFNSVGTTNGVADVKTSCTTDFTLTPPADPTPAGMSPKLVYTSQSLSPTLVITAETPTVVDITLPTVSIIAPGAGATFVGTNALTASASDNVGVVGLQFMIDGANFSAEITAPPYTTVWNSTTVADGAHTVSARARDAAGNSATSAPVTVTVSNAPPPPPLDTTPPSVSITSPVAGATVSGTVTLAASAADNVGVVGVQFGLDGANLGAEDTTAPYSLAWVTTAVADGAHTLNAVARDAAGNRASSSLVTVTVKNAITPPSPPLGISPDGSKITPASGGSLTTAAGKWTFGTATGAGGNVILLNGAQALSGEATELYVLNVSNLYAFNLFSNWFQWNGAGWTRLAAAPPGAPHP